MTSGAGRRMAKPADHSLGSPVRRAVGAMLALGVAALAGGCATAPPPPPASVAEMRIALRWGGNDGVPLPHPLRGVPPRAVVIEWNPAAFSAGDVRYAAEQACLAFNAQAQPQQESVRGDRRVTVFTCGAPLSPPAAAPGGSAS